MNLPFVQVAMELLEQLAPEAAIDLGHDEDAVLGKLIRLIRWAIRRCPDDKPPSQSSLVAGSNAAKYIARGCLWMGDPDAFVDALCRGEFAILERVDGGIRVRGLDRYDEAWKRARTRSGKAKAAADKRWGNAQDDAQAMLERCSDDAPRCLDGDREEDGEAEADTPPSEVVKEARPPPSVILDYRPPETPEGEWTGDDFFCWVQAKRIESKLQAERRPRFEKLRDWWAAVMTTGVKVRALKEAFYSYSEDPFWARKKPPHPFYGFMSQWRDHVPQEAA